jgi:hypothetical protein
VYRIKSELDQLLGFDTVSAHAETGEIEDTCLINLQDKHNDVSHVVASVSLPMLDEQMMLASNIVVRCRFQDIHAVMNVFHSTKYDNKTMRGFYYVFLLSSKVHCGRSYQLSQILHQDHVHSSDDLTMSRHMSRNKSFSSQVHHKCIEIANNVRLALIIIGMKQKLTNHKQISMPPGMWNMIK